MKPNRNNRRGRLARHGAGAFLATALAVAAHAAAADAAGTVVLAKGTVSAQLGSAEARSVDKNAEVFVGDTITTATKSYAVIRFSDGGKVTVRPDSVLVIDAYAFGGSNDGTALNLVKGGLRALTGAIAKTNPDAYRVNTPVATLGVRGTEFDIRLCEEDCAEEQSQLTVDVLQK